MTSMLGAMLVKLLIVACFIAAVGLISDIRNSLAQALAGETDTRSTTQGMSEPSQPAPLPPGDPKRGEVLYNASCVVCHGANAAGNIGPRLAGNPILSNDKAFLEVVTFGRHAMPPLKDTLTSQQLADIQAWLKTLR